MHACLYDYQEWLSHTHTPRRFPVSHHLAPGCAHARVVLAPASCAPRKASSPRSSASCATLLTKMENRHCGPPVSATTPISMDFHGHCSRKKRTVLCSGLCVTQDNPTHVIVASQLVIVSFCIDVVHVGAVPLQFSGTFELLLAHVTGMPPDIHVVRVSAVLL